jgi:uncharacterized coiled-coil protein SlyX
MIKDISIIREELNNFIEIKLPHPLTKNCHIKYITLKNDLESFYTGGEFLSYGNDSLLLIKNNRTWSVPTCFRNKDGSIQYESRFFIYEKNEEKCDKKTTELNDTISFQQSVIDKLSDQLKNIEIHRKQLIDTNQDYEELLQQNRYHLKELSIQSREKDKKLLQYEDIIQKLSQSHPLMKK